jgi:hypothetical protein
MVGYATGGNYMIYVPTKRRVYTTSDVSFEEGFTHVPPMQQEKLLECSDRYIGHTKHPVVVDPGHGGESSGDGGAMDGNTLSPDVLIPSTTVGEAPIAGLPKAAIPLVQQQMEWNNDHYGMELMRDAYVST